jgi:exocyst complex component 6
VTALDNFLLTLFEKYAELLKRRFSEDFQEVGFPSSQVLFLTDIPMKIVSTDDYMPMPISNLDEYDKVVNVSWFTPDKPREELM